jgi:hypothetical protein
MIYFIEDLNNYDLEKNEMNLKSNENKSEEDFYDIEDEELVDNYN